MRKIVDTEIWFGMRVPRSQDSLKKAKNIQPNRLTELSTESTNKVTSSPRENESYWQNQQGHKARRRVRLHIWERLKSSYFKLESFDFLFQVYNWSYSTRAHSQASGINIKL
jgi:hypothetical protein